jgi:FkbM family methyltransferase
VNLIVIKQSLTKLLPRRLRVPVRYYYNKVIGTLEPEMAYLKDFIGEGKRAIDVGANTGLYTYALSKLFQTVEAFEPIPWIFDDTSAYNCPNVNFHNVGISDCEDILNLNIPEINGKPSGAQASFRRFLGEYESIPVPVKRLDDYQFDEVSFVKIDVEGYESKVLDGAIETIKSCHPNLLIEIEQRHLQGEPINQIFEKILQLGYCGYFLVDGEFLDVSNFSYELHQKPFIRQVELVGHCKGYVNNFIFRSK